MFTSTLAAAIQNGEHGTIPLRLRAMVAHMTGTVIVAALTFALIRFLWYPDFYWAVAGGGGLFLLICSIDAVLGPLLTFSIFNPAKGSRRLKTDLIVIVGVQLIALCYGLWTIATVRPLFLAYSVDRFNLVRASEITPDELGEAELPQYRKVSWGKPKLIGTREPKNPDEKIHFVDSALSGRDRHFLPKTYVPFEHVIAKMLDHARPLESLKSATNNQADLIAKTVSRFSVQHTKLGFVPVIAQGDWVMIMDRETGELLDVLPLDGLN